MYDELRDFSELNLKEVDFNKPCWSWGFGVEDDYGYIYHTDEMTEDYYQIAYKIPKCIADMIVDSRDYAVNNFKSRLIELETKRDKLLGL